VRQDSRHKNLDFTKLSDDRHDIEVLLDFVLTQIENVHISSLFKHFVFYFFLCFLLIASWNYILPANVWQKVFKVVCITVLKFFVLLCLINYILKVNLLKSFSFNNAIINFFTVLLYLFHLFLLL
jgi:heme A synthase